MLNEAQNQIGGASGESREGTYSYVSGEGSSPTTSKAISQKSVPQKNTSQKNTSQKANKTINLKAVNLKAKTTSAQTVVTPIEDTEKGSVVKDLFSLAMRRIRQRLQNNWNAKLASVILAIIVWSLITANERATQELRVAVPLTILGQVNLSEAYPLPRNIEVNVSGTNARLEDLRIRDLTATLDLRNVSGEFQERVRVTRPRGIMIESYTPEIIAGEVE